MATKGSIPLRYTSKGKFMTNFKIVTNAPPLMHVAKNPLSKGKREYRPRRKEAKFLTIKAQVKAPNGSLTKFP